MTKAICRWPTDINVLDSGMGLESLRSCCCMAGVRKRNLWLKKMEPWFLEAILHAGSAHFHPETGTKRSGCKVEGDSSLCKKKKQGRKKHLLQGVLRKGEFSGLCSGILPHLSSLSDDLSPSLPVLSRQLSPARACLSALLLVFLFSCQRTGLNSSSCSSGPKQPAAASASLQQTHHWDHLPILPWDTWSLSLIMLLLVREIVFGWCKWTGLYLRNPIKKSPSAPFFHCEVSVCIWLSLSRLYICSVLWLLSVMTTLSLP